MASKKQQNQVIIAILAIMAIILIVFISQGRLMSSEESAGEATSIVVVASLNEMCRKACAEDVPGSTYNFDASCRNFANQIAQDSSFAQRLFDGATKPEPTVKFSCGPGFGVTVSIRF